MDLSDHCVLIMAGTTRAGRRMAETLAMQRATVILGTSDARQGQQVRKQLVAKTHHPHIHTCLLNATNPHSVEKAVATLKTLFPHLNSLVLNTDQLFMRDQKTIDGFESTYAYNVLGPLRVSLSLSSLLLKNAKPTIITFGSDQYPYPGRAFDYSMKINEHAEGNKAENEEAINEEAIEEAIAASDADHPPLKTELELTAPHNADAFTYNPFKAYVEAKLATLIITSTLSSRLGDKIAVLSLDTLSSSSVRELSILRLGARYVANRFRPSRTHADTVAQLLISPKRMAYSGCLIQKGKPRRKLAICHEIDQNALWEKLMADLYALDWRTSDFYNTVIAPLFASPASSAPSTPMAPLTTLLPSHEETVSLHTTARLETVRHETAPQEEEPHSLV